VTAVLLWDFGDTLCDETWMRRAPDSKPTWTAAWRDVMDAVADDWDTGRIDERAVFAAMAERTGMTTDAVARHAAECCGSLVLHPVAWRVATERRRPQALVTVNPDLFVLRIVPEYRLESIFDEVVVSSVEQTTDKVQLCEIALARLGYTGDRRGALLIDNREDLVGAWRANGGSAYLYRDDASFQTDVDELLA
jgi:hypothetical protein